MNPVIAGFITYNNLKDGSVNLYDIFVMNEAIKYKSDYEASFNEIVSSRLSK